MNWPAVCTLSGIFFSTLLPQVGVAGSLGGPLRLADEGIFFVAGRTIETDFAGISPGGPTPRGRVAVDQMYVHYRIPEGTSGKPPIVLVHGAVLTGATYETTPDGREGWATYFVRMGYPVYVVDAPGRGRSGFNAAPINQAKSANDAKLVPANLMMLTEDLAWTAFRFGPKFGTAFPGLQFPTEAIDASIAQSVPTAEATLDGGAMQTAPRALAALLDRIGPAVMLTHSQSGPFADTLVAMRPKLMRAVVNIEGTQVPVSDAQIAAYRGIPVMELFGDYLDAPVFTGAPRLQARQSVVDRINRQEGGDALLVTLPSIGIRGNSHMMMQDRNNLQVADHILAWLRSHNN